LKYKSDDFSPTYTVGNFLSHLFQLCSQISNQIEVFVAPSDILIGKLNQRDSISGQISTVLAEVLKIRKSTLTGKDKREFLDCWYNYKEIYKKE